MAAQSSLRVALPFFSLALSSLVACSESKEPSEQRPAEFSASLCPLQEGQSPVAPAADGVRVAFLSCESGAEILVHDFDAEETVSLAEASPSDSLRWLQDEGFDERFVLFGSSSSLAIAPDDASAEAVNVGGGAVLDHRVFKQKINDTDFQPRVLVLERTLESKRVGIWRPDDGYAEPTVLIDEPTIVGDLSQLSASGRTLVLSVGEAGEATGYIKQLTSGSAQSKTLPFGPRDWSMAPVGLGDQHNFALNGDELVRIELETGVLQMIVPAGSGLHPGTDHLISREEAPGKKYVYYIQNGDPTRRIREGDEEPETLAEANAVAQVMTPDYATLLYLSDGALFAVSALGGESRLLVEGPSSSERIVVAYSGSTPDDFSARGQELVYQSDGQLFRIRLDGDSVEPIEGATAAPGSVRYDALGEAILFLDDAGALQRVASGATEPQQVADSIAAFWPLPKSPNLLVDSDDTLTVLELE